MNNNKYIYKSVHHGFYDVGININFPDSTIVKQNINDSCSTKMYKLSGNPFETFFEVYHLNKDRSFHEVLGRGGKKLRTIALEEYCRVLNQMARRISAMLTTLERIALQNEVLCYEGEESYIIHIPNCHYRIMGFKKEYVFLEDSMCEIERYFLKENTHDWKLEEDFIDTKVKPISKEYYRDIVMKWGSLLKLIRSNINEKTESFQLKLPYRKVIKYQGNDIVKLLNQYYNEGFEDYQTFLDYDDGVYEFITNKGCCKAFWPLVGRYKQYIILYLIAGWFIDGDQYPNKRYDFSDFYFTVPRQYWKKIYPNQKYDVTIKNRHVVSITLQEFQLDSS